MKGRNALLLKLTRKLFIAVLLIIICTTSGVYATDITPDDGNTTEPTVTTTLPYIEMKVKAVKVGESNQILVEMWGSNFTNLEAIEFVFTYNNAKLTPSNVSNNEIVNDLDLYKYEKRPTQAGDKPTALELLEQAEFDQNSTETLSKAFNFETEYASSLDIDLFRYLAPDGNNEAMQFIMSKKDENSNISAIDPVLLGKFSFRQTEGTTLDETELATSRIKVSCDDGVTPGEESYYVRDVENGENCEEIVEFTYEKYGSISGKIKASIINPKDNEVKLNATIKTLTIKIFDMKDESVKDMKMWKTTGATYKNTKLSNTGEEKEIGLPQPYQEHQIQLEADGTFTIPSIEFGEYVILIDKDYYGDFIITNVKINSENKDIDFSKYEELEEINIIPGDINNDGLMNSYDSNIYTKDKKGGKANQKINLDDASDRTGINGTKDSNWFTASYNTYRTRGQNIVKKIYNLEGGTYEK